MKVRCRLQSIESCGYCLPYIAHYLHSIPQDIIIFTLTNTAESACAGKLKHKRLVARIYFGFSYYETRSKFSNPISILNYSCQYLVSQHLSHLFTGHIIGRTFLSIFQIKSSAGWRVWSLFPNLYVSENVSSFPCTRTGNED